MMPRAFLRSIALALVLLLGYLAPGVAREGYQLPSRRTAHETIAMQRSLELMALAAEQNDLADANLYELLTQLRTAAQARMAAERAAEEEAAQARATRGEPAPAAEDPAPEEEPRHRAPIEVVDFVERHRAVWESRGDTRRELRQYQRAQWQGVLDAAAGLSPQRSRRWIVEMQAVIAPALGSEGIEMGPMSQLVGWAGALADCEEIIQREATARVLRQDCDLCTNQLFYVFLARVADAAETAEVLASREWRTHAAANGLPPR